MKEYEDTSRDTVWVSQQWSYKDFKFRFNLPISVLNVIQDNEYDIEKGRVMEEYVQSFSWGILNKAENTVMPSEIYIPVQDVQVISRVNLKSSKGMKMGSDTLYSNLVDWRMFLGVFLVRELVTLYVTCKTKRGSRIRKVVSIKVSNLLISIVIIGTIDPFDQRNDRWSFCWKILTLST